MMDYRISIVLLTLLLCSSDVVKGSSKSKSSRSFGSKNVKNFCTTCKVTRKLGNNTVAIGDRVVLKCAFKGIQSSNITWRRNGRLVRETKNVVINEWPNHDGSKLRIKKVSSRETGTYRCTGVNVKDQYIHTTGYVKIRPKSNKGKKLPTTASVVSKQRVGKCEMYKGTRCRPYIQDNVLIFVDRGRQKSQEFIEMKLQFGYDHMFENLTKSCKSAALPLWCHHHFPQCSVANAKAEPKSLCKSECNIIQSDDCKAEYDETKQESSQSSEDDLFPNCKLLPSEDPLQSNCVSIKRYVPSLRTGPTQTSGKCVVYKGDVCKKKRGKKVFVKDGMKISDIEKIIKETLEKRNYVSNQCQTYIQPLLCQLRLPECDESSETPKGKPICQDECLVLQKKYCKKEYSEVKKLSATSIFFDCSTVLPLTAASGKCSPIGIPEKDLPSTNYPTTTRKPKIGRCQPYKGTICKDYLEKKNIFVEVENVESNIEEKLKIAITEIEKFPQLSRKCKPFVLPLMCHHLFPYCELDSQPKPRFICREDCFRVKNEFCLKEYPIAEHEKLTGSILFPSCHDLPKSNEGCTSLEKYFRNDTVDDDDKSSNETGDYKGTLAISTKGECQTWSKHDSENNWSHNYCRNPGNKKDKPWCYIATGERAFCDIPTTVSANQFPESDSSGHLSNLLYTVIPCVVFGMIVAVVIIAVCWKRHKQGPDAIKNTTRMTVTVMLPELRTIPGENILLPKFIGSGRFGLLYSGEICSEDGSRVSRLVTVAPKDSREEFINQAKRWSQFHHPNLLTIEAITSASEPMTLVYEPAGHGSLYQYLIYHSPNNPNFTQDHALLDKANLLDISRQIAAGMAYLSSHDYVHGELMTRNCQVAHSMVIKITDFTVDRDVTYFRRPNKRPIALGWMAPETIQTETYTVHSDVWAFGVLLWEIFTYGFQPYFGFTFLEVREKILNMMLLEQPRDCIPVIYEIMRNCWTKTPSHRPQFVDLHEDLNTLCHECFEEDDAESHYFTKVSL